MPEQGGTEAGWKKSSKSTGSDTCVEVRFRPGYVDVRHSQASEGPILVFSAAEWAAFVEGISNSELRG